MLRTRRQQGGNRMSKHKPTVQESDAALTAVNIANMGSNLIPKLGGPLGVGLTALGSDIEAEREERGIARKLGTRHLDSMQYMPAVKSKLGELRGRWKEGAVSASAGIAGSMAAMGAAGLLFTGPIGWVPGLLIGGAGAIAGGYAGNKTYKKITGRIQDTLAIAVTISDTLKKGEQVPEEVVFAALASKLRGREGKEASAMLYEKTGSRYFQDAVEQGKMDALREMMQSPRMERMLRRRSNMPLDMSDMSKSVVTQYAEYLNSGRMGVKALLKSFSPLDVRPEVQHYVPQSAAYASPSVTPSMQNSRPIAR